MRDGRIGVRGGRVVVRVGVWGGLVGVISGVTRGHKESCKRVIGS